MEKPKIIINGKTYKMKEPKSKAWRLITEIDENKEDIPNVELVEKFVEVIAELFDGVTKEELLENMDIADVFPTFYSCYTYTSKVLFTGTKKLDSTKGEGEAVTA